MSGFDEIRMFIYGTEAELRPVNAESYLKNLAIAKKYYSDSGEFAEKAVFWAGMISDSAFDGEERMFTSYEDVLQKLTMSEISEIGNELYSSVLLPDMQENGKRGNYAYDFENYTESMSESDADFNTEPGNAVTGAKGSDGSEWDAENDRFSQVMRRADMAMLRLSELGLTATREQDGTISLRRPALRADNETGYTEDLPDGSSDAAYPTVGMRRISDYFERDSRRYDGPMDRKG